MTVPWVQGKEKRLGLTQAMKMTCTAALVLLTNFISFPVKSTNEAVKKTKAQGKSDSKAEKAMDGKPQLMEIEVKFGERETRYKIDTSRKPHSVTLSNNRGKRRKLMLKPDDLSFLQERTKDIASLPSDNGPCPRSKMELIIQGPEKGAKKTSKTIRKRFSSCLQSKSEGATKLRNLLDVLSIAM